MFSDICRCRFARIDVNIHDPTTSIKISTHGVKSFTIDPATLLKRSGISILGRTIFVNGDASIPPLDDCTSHLNFRRNSNRQFEILANPPPARRYGPLITILTSPTPLIIVIGTRGTSGQKTHLTSIARRIAHDAFLYIRVDVEILHDTEWEEGSEREGNVVLLGDASTNSVLRARAIDWSIPGESPFRYTPLPLLLAISVPL